jgi:hypothetical protein
VFAVVGLDPTAGLDPAVREVTRTRLFAERVLFVTERLPFLLRWQTEALAQDVFRQTEVTDALASLDRLSRAAEVASRTAEALPNRVTAGRQALLAAMEGQEGKLRALSAEVGQTLAAGERLAVALNTTLTTFDALMKRFGVGEAPRSAPGSGARAFDILDYAHTAEQIAAMAERYKRLR